MDSSRRSSARLAAFSASNLAPTTPEAKPSKTAIKRKPPAATVVANGNSKKTTNGKAANGAQNDCSDRAAVPPPSTPNPKRRKKNDDTAPAPALPPTTPTPSLVGIMAAGELPTPNSSKRRPARPAAPHATNALLRTPTGSRVLSSSDAPKGSPSSGYDVANTTKDIVSLSFDKTTTDTLLQEACEHLCAVDETGKLASMIAQHHCRLFSPEGLREEINPFASLASSIIAQQVSGAAASSIKRKFVSLFPGPGLAPALTSSSKSVSAATTGLAVSAQTPPKTYFPTPAAVAAKAVPELRVAGLSQRKAEYIHGLAEKFRDGELTAAMLVSAGNDEVLERLVAVRGLGRWSAEMFSCFALKRMDVFSTGDLGVQRGMAAFVGRDVAKLKGKGGKWKYMSEQEMVEISDRYRPFRSLFMWYMWRVEDSVTDVNAISGD